MSQTGETGTETEVESGTERGEETFVGKGLNRVEDHRILTGQAEYVHDITPEGCLHMALLRTTHPHADIVDIDTSEAWGCGLRT